MNSHLRNLFFRLLNGYATLQSLRNTLQSKTLHFSSEEQIYIEELVSFLEQVRRDTYQYISDQKIENEKADIVFNNFLAALRLTQDQRLNQGPVYAMQNVALDSAWSDVTRGFNEEKEKHVTQQLDDWISLLNSLLESGNIDSSAMDSLDIMLSRFRETIDVLEQAL